MHGMEMYYRFYWVARESKLYDHLSQSEIDELVTISNDKTFLTLRNRYETLYDKWKRGEFGNMTEYQVVRNSLVFIVTYLAQKMEISPSLRVRAIIGGFLKTELDKMEYHVNFDMRRYVDLIRAFPHLGDMDLAQQCIANKIGITGESRKDTDLRWIMDSLAVARKNINHEWRKAAHPITPRESIFAERWLEIYERQK